MSEQDLGASTSRSSPATDLPIGARILGALAYGLGLFTALPLLMLARDRFVRFHAWQSLLLSGVLLVAWVALSILVTFLAFLPRYATVVVVVGLGLVVATGVAWGLLSVTLAVQALRGRLPKLPYVGALSERYSGALSQPKRRPRERRL